jgi:hypothetical protein
MACTSRACFWAVPLAKPWKTPFRLYLTGRLVLELGERRFDERRLPGRQGRRAFAYLTLKRTRPVPIDELADAVWSAASPAGAWETALSAIVSKFIAPSPETEVIVRRLRARG